MADEEKKEEGKEEKKSSSLVLIIVAVLIVLLLVIGGVVVYLMLSQDEAQQGTDPNTGAPVQAKQVAKKSALDLTVGPMYPLDQFIVNLLSEGGRRYLKTTVDFELSGDELIEELDSKIPRVRDIIIRVLSSKTVEEITTPKGKEKLKEELMNQVNSVLVDGQIVRLYFTDFVIQ